MLRNAGMDERWHHPVNLNLSPTPPERCPASALKQIWCISLFIKVLHWSHITARQSDVCWEKRENAPSPPAGRTEERRRSFIRLPRRLLPQRFAPAIAEIAQNTFTCPPRFKARIHTSVFSVLNKSWISWEAKSNCFENKETRQRHESSD